MANEPLTQRGVTESKTSSYDVAEHLRTPEECVAYLDAWLEGAPDDYEGITRAVGDITRAQALSQFSE